jgi:hypothetical protein
MWTDIQSSRQPRPPLVELILYMTLAENMKEYFNLLFEKKVSLRDNLAV